MGPIDDEMSDGGFSYGRIQLAYITGIIDTSAIDNLYRSIFRCTKGKAIFNKVNLEDHDAVEQLAGDVTDPNLIVNKSVFFIVFPISSRDSIISRKLIAASDAYNARLVKMPASKTEIYQLISDCEKEKSDFLQLLEGTKNHLRGILSFLSDPSPNLRECSYIEEIRLTIVREKAILSTLNMFVRVSESLLVGSFWTPKSMAMKVEDSMKELKKTDKMFTGVSIIQVDTGTSKPPTHFPLNDFTRPFQEIVNTYGVPKYKEVNPALVTIVTFSYQFGVMFGDVAHGFFLLAAGLWICHTKGELEFITGVFRKKKNEKPKKNQKENSALSAILDLRYLLIMIGFFSVYCGFIYNDFMSLKMVNGTSCYRRKGTEFVRDEGCNYVTGFDHVWGLSEGEINYTNSFKMKLSIIIGVVHMTLGIIFKAMNNIHESHIAELILETVPQFLFFTSLFGYMVLCIIVKWLTNWQGVKEPPSIINIFINFTSEPEVPLFGSSQLQVSIQYFLLVIAMISMPVMLLGKPIYIYCVEGKKKRRTHQKLVSEHDFGQISMNSEYSGYSQETQEDSSEILAHFSPYNPQEEEGEHLEEFGEIIIHQLIETIEFVLGSISNTASYLRLWALSLAHGQLAKVFFELLFAENLQKPSGYISGTFGIVVGFTFLFQATAGVLLLMDVMECFLHALRLHWVEFQSKFFKGGGYKFEALSLIELSKRIESKE